MPATPLAFHRDLLWARTPCHLFPMGLNGRSSVYVSRTDMDGKYGSCLISGRVTAAHSYAKVLSLRLKTNGFFLTHESISLHTQWSPKYIFLPPYFPLSQFVDHISSVLELSIISPPSEISFADEARQLGPEPSFTHADIEMACPSECVLAMDCETYCALGYRIPFEPQPSERLKQRT